MNNAKSFQRLETIGGILLFVSAFIAIILSNTPLGELYQRIINTAAQIRIGDFEIHKPIVLWINDGLMAMYFLLVGLEIKREIKRGILSNVTSIIVPLIAAIFGLLFPAIIYWIFNAHDNSYMKGWAIPTATDIAFTLSILSLLGSRVPVSLKILLTTIAIFDDIAAIIIIAIFYTSQLSTTALVLASASLITLIALNISGCKKLSVYVVIGIILWTAVLKSGVHATLAGVALAMAIPDDENDSILGKIEKGLHPWVVFMILPLFAFVNAGVSFEMFDWHALIHPVFLGVSLGLFLGKQLGVFLPLWYFVKFKHYLSQDAIKVSQVYGVALICGVGFTMSLFVNSLAFKGINQELLYTAKIAIVIASLISGAFGYLVLRKTSSKAETSLSVDKQVL
jgi:NhaA family Na+:H+ antiporter